MNAQYNHVPVSFNANTSLPSICTLSYMTFTEDAELKGMYVELLALEDFSICNQLLAELTHRFLMMDSSDFSKNLIKCSVKDITYRDMKKLLEVDSSTSHFRNVLLEKLWVALTNVSSDCPDLPFSTFLLSIELDIE